MSMNFPSYTAIWGERFYSLFPVPKVLAMPAVGFDVSDHAVRFVEFAETRTGLRLGRYGARPVPKGAIADGDIIKHDEVQNLLRTIREEQHLDFIRASLPAEKAYVFTTRIPGTGQTREDIRSILEFKLEGYVPIAPKEALFDYTIIGAAAGGKYLDVSVTVVPKTLVESYLQLFKDAGLTPLSFEVEAEAIARSSVAGDDQRTLMLVDFGAVKTGIAIVSRGIVQFTSVLELSGRELTAALQQKLSLSFHDAEGLKKEKGLATQKGNERVFEALVGTVDRFKNEINRHLIYWNTHEEARGGEGKPVTAVVLCGGGSNLIGLAEYVSAGLGKEVSTANVWVNAFSFETYVPDIPFDQSLSYVTAIGLALRGARVKHARALSGIIRTEF